MIAERRVVCISVEGAAEQDVDDVQRLVIRTFADSVIAQAGGQNCPSATWSLEPQTFANEVLASKLVIGPSLVPAATNLLRAISNGDFSRLSNEAHDRLYGLASEAAARRWHVELTPDWQAQTAILGPGHAVPAPEPRQTLRGGTTVYGTLVAVGAPPEGPWARLRLHTGDEVDAALPADLLEPIRERLGEIIGLDGEAVWELPSGRIVEFRATALSPFRQTPMAEAIERLREVVDGALDGVDPLALRTMLEE